MSHLADINPSLGIAETLWGPTAAVTTTMLSLGVVMLAIFTYVSYTLYTYCKKRKALMNIEEGQYWH